MGDEGSSGGGRDPQIMFNTRSSADVKPDADVDDWEAIATDEEKGEVPFAPLLPKSIQKWKTGYEFTCMNIPNCSIDSFLSASDLKKVHIEVKEETSAPPQPGGSEEEEEDDDEDEDEEDDDDEDDVSEEEPEKEVTVASQQKRRRAKESEDESSASDDDDGRTKEERLYDRAKRRIEVGKRAGGTAPSYLTVFDFSVCRSGKQRT